MWHSGQTCLFEPALVNKNERLLTVSVETVLMAKYRPSKNQSQRFDLPQGYLASQQVESQNDKAEAMILTTHLTVNVMITLDNYSNPHCSTK